MARSSLLAQSLARLLEEDVDRDVRFVDMGLSLRALETGEELLHVGGVWDKRRKRYIRNPRREVTLYVHEGQRAAAEWLADWMRRRASGDWTGFDRVWSALFVGGRRGGKTHLAVVALCIFAVLHPGANIWAVSPTQEETDELDRELRRNLARRWYRYEGKPKFKFSFANGSTIRLLSGYKPSSLKRGGVDFALYNEAQLMQQRGFIQLRGATADSGGLTIATANPPDTPIGRWIEDWWEKVRAGRVESKAFQFDPRDNPFIEYESLKALEAEVDDATFRREVLGEFVPIGDRVFYAWSDSFSVREVPAGFVDITREFTKRHFGREFDHIVGADFQKLPMVAVVLKVYRDPEDEAETPLLWVADEAVLEHADEFDLIDELEGPAGGTRCPCCAGTAGYDGASSVAIADASGDWQFAERKPAKVAALKRTVKGSGSFDVFRRRGWKFIYPPDREMDKNPDIVERVKLGNALLCARNGVRRLFSCPHNERVNRSMKYWENREGVPHRRSEHAHLCDAVTYPAWRLFPRRGGVESAAPEVKVVKRFRGRQRMKGW